MDIGRVHLLPKKRIEKVIKMKEKMKIGFTKGFVKVATWTIIFVVAFINVINWFTKKNK